MYNQKPIEPWTSIFQMLDRQPERGSPVSLRDLRHSDLTLAALMLLAVATLVVLTAPIPAVAAECSADCDCGGAYSHSVTCEGDSCEATDNDGCCGVENGPYGPEATCEMCDCFET